MSSFVRKLRRLQKKKSGERVYSHARAEVTKPRAPDIYDAETPHPLDSPDIVETLTEQKIMREEGWLPPPNEKFEDPLPRAGYRPPLTQFTVDAIRMRVLRATAVRAKKDLARQKDIKSYTKVKHLWFKGAHADAYELRDGNPPPDSQRPRYMRGLDLVIDVFNPEMVIGRHRQFANLAKFVDFQRDDRPRIVVPELGEIRLPSRWAR